MSSTSHFKEQQMKGSKGIAEQAVVVILAAGKGTRMGSRYMAKVCFEIEGVPAVNRIIETFKVKHFSRFLVVIGSMAGQVLETVGRAHPEVAFVYQSPQLGTGHAGKIAAGALQKLGHSGPVVLTMGDKYIEPVAVEMLVDGFLKQQADLVLLTVPDEKTRESSTGRVLVDKSGRAVAVIERFDLARQAIVDELRRRLTKGQTVSGSVVLSVAKKHITDREKMVSAVPELLSLADKSGRVNRRRLRETLQLDKYNLRVGGRDYTARQIKRICTQFNPSLYLFKAQAFYRGVSMIDNNNAQGEYYLTDVVRHLSRITDKSGGHRFEVRTVAADNAEVIRGFNSLSQLLSI